MVKFDLSTDPKFKEIYEDSLGNKWYTYVNAADIDAVRGVAAIRAERYIALKINEAELKLAIDAQIQAAKEQDWLKVGAIAYDLKTRLQMLTEENSLLDLAGIYCLLQDENPSMYMDSVIARKQKIWQEDKKARSFFLPLAINLTKSLENMPEGDLLTFLEKTKETAERIYRHIPAPIERSSS